MFEAKLPMHEAGGSQVGMPLGTGENEVWEAPPAGSALGATVALPASKSLMAREMVLSALAATPSVLKNALDSRDTTLMTQALKNLGTGIEIREAGDGEREMTVTPAVELLGSTSIECGLAGTVMRFVPPLAALALGPTSFDGDPYARNRPMAGLLDALEELGADIADDGARRLPFTIHGTGALRGGEVRVDSSASSQYVTALLMIAPRLPGGLRVKHTGATLPSLPHIEMTLTALRERGVDAQTIAADEWIVGAGDIAGAEITLEPDLSNAAPFLAAALVAGGSVTVPHWPAETTQVGDHLRHLLPEYGASVSLEDGSLRVTGGGEIKPVRLHIPDAGELAPTLVGLAALATGPSEITGIEHIRGHETDRLAALQTELTKIGCEVEEIPGGLRITPPAGRAYTPAVWMSYADHRMATTGSLVGLGVPGMQIENIACTGKTMPRFVSMWEAMLGQRGESL